MPSAISRHNKHKKSRKQNPIANRPQPVDFAALVTRAAAPFPADHRLGNRRTIAFLRFLAVYAPIPATARADGRPG